MVNKNLPRPKGYENYKFPFEVKKPWGKEVWLELFEDPATGRGYCYKRIYINADTKTSFQYHEKKIETNYLISGNAELWLENENGVLEKKTIGPNESFTVLPKRKHRVIALTDIILQEVSTPEVDDVVRIEDDSRRSNGKINSEHFKVF
ncbi:hypothetical protein K9L16_03360 [Candidatus Pacearchaeota archaeon]|nr:hypothetical protein [Candidatus Pacearchaeota archaeon]